MWQNVIAGALNRNMKKGRKFTILVWKLQMLLAIVQMILDAILGFV